MNKQNEPANQSKRRFFAKKDIVIITAVLLIAAAGLLVKYLIAPHDSESVAEIYSDSKMVKSVILRPGLNEKFAVPGKPYVVLLISGGRIRFYSSTCRDKICVKAGFLSRPGESAACLPNKVVIKIVAAGNNNSSGADTYSNSVSDCEWFNMLKQAQCLHYAYHFSLSCLAFLKGNAVYIIISD